MLAGMLYFSLADSDLDGAQLAEIVRNARERNALVGITGQLHYENGLFLQWLEGPADDVLGLWNKIFLDRRHTRITKMYAGKVSTRKFGAWEMQFTDRKDAYLFDYIKSRGISLESRSRADASKLLSFLHEVATTDRYRPIESIERLADIEELSGYFPTLPAKTG